MVGAEKGCLGQQRFGVRCKKVVQFFNDQFGSIVHIAGYLSRDRDYVFLSAKSISS